MGQIEVEQHHVRLIGADGQHRFGSRRCFMNEDFWERSEQPSHALSYNHMIVDNQDLHERTALATLAPSVDVAGRRVGRFADTTTPAPTGAFSTLNAPPKDFTR